MSHYAGVYNHVLKQIQATRPNGEPITRREIYDEVFDRMMGHARYELERCLRICFEHPGPVVLVPQHDDRYLIPVEGKNDLWKIHFQLTERFHLMGPHHWRNGMGTRLFPGKVLRHQSHEVTARRAYIRALQTYRLPSERRAGFWPFTDPRR